MAQQCVNHAYTMMVNKQLAHVNLCSRSVLLAFYPQRLNYCGDLKWNAQWCTAKQEMCYAQLYTYYTSATYHIVSQVT